MERRKTVTPAPKRVPTGPEAFVPAKGTAVTWLGSAGFLINARGTILLIDPVLCTEPGDPLRCETGLKLVQPLPIQAKEVPRADAVLYTHTDDDHLASRTAVVLACCAGKMIGPPPVFEKLVRLGIPAEQVEVRREGERFELGEVSVEVFPADHPWQLLNPAKFGRPFRRGDCCGYRIRTPDLDFFLSGDTRMMEEHLDLSGVELLALDVSPCPFHLGDQAQVLANLLKEAWLLPCHYGTFDAPQEEYAHLGNPDDVLCEVENADRRTILAAPGEAVLFHAHQRVEHQRVERG